MRSNRIYWLFAAAVSLVALTWAGAYRTVTQESARNFLSKAEQAQQLATFFERQTVSTVRYADAYLKMVRREYLTGTGLESVQALIDEVPLDRNIVSHITIIDAAGTPIFNSGYAIKPGTSARDRDYFKIQKAASRDELHMSLPLRGRNSGQLLVRLVRRIELPGGAFGGVVFAALDANSVTEFFSAMNLGPNSSATLVGNDKKIRARSSYGRLGPGQDISGSRIWRELERAPVGLYLQTSVVDQLTRHYAYRQLSEFPLVVTIGIADKDLSSELAGLGSPVYAIALLVSVLILTATVMFAREVLARAKITASEARIRDMNDELELRVEERTAQLEATQQELLRKQRLAVLGQLTGTVAHELRNPLGTIITSVTLIERRLQNSPVDLVATVERVRRSVARCNAIITELLDFTRVTALDLQAIEVDPWIANTVAELADPCAVTIRCELNAKNIVLRMDTERVRRALINLIDNARDALRGDASEGGAGRAEIQVLTRYSADRVEIEVRDAGPGIPESLLASVHEPLFSTKSFGIGLGLPVVNQVMEDHGGGFEIESGPDRGTRAVIWFPRQRETPASAGADTEAAEESAEADTAAAEE